MLVGISGYQTYQTREIAQEERRLRQQERVEGWLENIRRPAVRLREELRDKFRDSAYTTNQFRGGIDLQRHQDLRLNIDILVEQIDGQIGHRPYGEDSEIDKIIRELVNEWAALDSMIAAEQNAVIHYNQDLHEGAKKLVEMVDSRSDAY